MAAGVDSDVLAGDGFEPQERDDNLGDVVSGGLALQRGLRQRLLPATRREVRRAFGRPGQNAVDEDTFSSELQREAARHEVRGCLAGEVRQVVEVGRLLSGPVAEEDEVTASRPVILHHGARRVQGEQEVRPGAGDTGVPGGGVELIERGAGVVSGEVDAEREVAERSLCFRDSIRYRGFVGEVGLQRDAAGGLRQPFGFGARVAVKDRDPDVLAGQAFDNGGTDSSRARDDGAPSSQIQHCVILESLSNLGTV